MVMVLEVVATGGSNSVELVIRQRMAELSASGFEGIGNTRDRLAFHS